MSFLLLQHCALCGREHAYMKMSSSVSANGERTQAKWMFTFERRRLLRLIAGKNNIEIVTRSLNKLSELWKNVMEKHDLFLKSSEEKGENEDYWLKIISLDLEEAEERYKAYIMNTAEALETTSLDQDLHQRMIENEKNEESTFKRKVDILNDFLDSSSSAPGGRPSTYSSRGSANVYTGDQSLLGSDSCGRSSLHSLHSSYSKITDSDTLTGSKLSTPSYGTIKDEDILSSSKGSHKSYSSKLLNDDCISTISDTGSFGTSFSKLGTDSGSVYSSKISDDDTTSRSKYSSRSILTKISDDDFVPSSKYSTRSCLSKISDEEFVPSSKDSTRSCLSKLTDEDIPLNCTATTLKSSSKYLDEDFLGRKSVSSYSTSSILDNNHIDAYSIMTSSATTVEADEDDLGYDKGKVAELLKRARDLCDFSEAVHSNLTDTSYSYSEIAEDENTKISTDDEIISDRSDTYGRKSRRQSRIFYEKDIDEKEPITAYEKIGTNTYGGLNILAVKGLGGASNDSENSSTSYLEVLSDNGIVDCEYPLVLPERPDGSRNW